MTTPLRRRKKRALLATLAVLGFTAAVVNLPGGQPSPAVAAVVAALPINSGGAAATQQAVRLTSPRPQFPTSASSGVPAGVSLIAWPWALRTSDATVPTEARNGMTCQVFDGYLVTLSGGSFLLVDSPCVIFRRTRFLTSGIVSNSGAIVQQSPANKYLEVTYSDFDGGPSHQRNLQGDHSDIVVKFSKFSRFGQAGVEMNNRSGTASLTVEDSYLYESPGWPKSYHVDGIQVGGGKNISIRRNTVLVELWGGTKGDTSYVSNSALGFWAELGDITGTVIVDSNLLAGGGYVIYISQVPPFAWPGPVFISNNVFDQHFDSNSGIWGTLYPNGHPANLTWSSNVWGGGGSLPLPQSQS